MLKVSNLFIKVVKTHKGYPIIYFNEREVVYGQTSSENLKTTLFKYLDSGEFIEIDIKKDPERDDLELFLQPVNEHNHNMLLDRYDIADENITTNLSK